jgi:Ca2+-binding EF-hand superfamily protein
MFDSSGDGVLSRTEFTDALEKLGLGDLANNEIEAILRTVDLDGDGQINYTEFSRKLARYGLR